MRSAERGKRTRLVARGAAGNFRLMTDATRVGAHGEDVANDALQGGGTMGALMRAADWTATTLGPVAAWPQSLKTTVSTCLCSRFPILIWWGPQLVMLYNDAYRAILGRKHPAALGAPGREVWPEIWEIIGPMLNGVLTRGEATWSEDQLLMLERHGYPEECYFTFSYSPVRDETGGVGGVFTAVTETTQRVVGERRLATLRALAERSARAHSPTEVAREGVRTLRENVADVPFAILYLEGDDAAGSPWPIAEVLSSGRSMRVAAPAPHSGVLPSGPWSDPPVEALALPVPGAAQGQPQGVLITGLNPHRELDDDYRGFLELAAGHIGTAVSRARAHEDERRRLEELAALDRAKTVFFSNVSHEFRTPLTLMMAPLEELLSRHEGGVEGGVEGDVESDADERRLVEMAHRNSLRLLKLVNTLLDFARIEAGRLEARFEPTDFAANSHELASAFRSTIERAGVRLDVRTPALREPVYLDRDLWEKVVLNLVSNAFKHTFTGSITVEVRERDEGAELRVIDTGVGIPADQLSRVFERFHRVTSARSRTHEGSGIGLALVQELVRLHGGRIRLESREGEGTEVSVWLPFGSGHLPSEKVGSSARAAELTPALTAYLSEASAWNVPGEHLAARPPARVAASSGTVSDVAGGRVLVVDDNADMAEYLSRLLRDRGCDVMTASDGRVALDLVRTWLPDLVISDVMMPGLDGFEMMAALRADERTRTIQVILLSARAGEEARVEGVSAGADDYIVKPFSARELLTRVQAHLQRSRQLAAERRASGESEQARAAAVAERSRLRELFLQAPAAIAVFRGPDHVYELTNPPYLRFIGGRKVVGKSIREALPELEGQGVYELLDEVYRTGEPTAMKELGIMLDTHGDGVPEEIFFNFVYQPIRNEVSAVTGIFVQAVDVTEQVLARRRAEALQHESEVARAEAVKASTAKSEFLAAMSHELRTPLNAIAGYAQLLLMELHGPVTPAQRDALQRVERSQRHLLRLINEVLNLARVESGRLDYDIQDFPVQQVVTELAPMIQPQFDARKVRYEVHLPAEPVMVRADRDKVTQVLINVLANAAKFTPAGGLVTLDVAQRAGIAATFIRVTDTGVGIPRDKQAQIFEPFVQVHTGPTRVAEGAGLGLAISYDLAKAMGGDLRVRSEVGKGARFTLSLPRGES